MLKSSRQSLTDSELLSLATAFPVGQEPFNSKIIDQEGILLKRAPIHTLQEYIEKANKYQSKTEGRGSAAESYKFGLKQSENLLKAQAIHENTPEAAEAIALRYSIKMEQARLGKPKHFADVSAERAYNKKTASWMRHSFEWFRRRDYLKQLPQEKQIQQYTFPSKAYDHPIPGQGSESNSKRRREKRVTWAADVKQTRQWPEVKSSSDNAA